MWWLFTVLLFYNIIISPVLLLEHNIFTLYYIMITVQPPHIQPRKPWIFLLKSVFNSLPTLKMAYNATLANVRRFDRGRRHDNDVIAIYKCLSA